MVLTIAVLLVVGTIVFTLFVRSQDVPEPAPVSPTAHLEERKSQIYENLRDLQFEYRLGKLSDADYQKTKWICSGNWRGCWRKSTRSSRLKPAPQPVQRAQAKVAVHAKAGAPDGGAGGQSERDQVPALRLDVSATDEILRRMRKGDGMRARAFLDRSRDAVAGLRGCRRRGVQRHHRHAAGRRDRLAGPAQPGGMTDHWPASGPTPRANSISTRRRRRALQR